VLAVGIDWSEQFHLVALGTPDQGVHQVVRVEHTPAAVEALLARIATLEPDPAEVRVVLETRHGVLVERLVDAGFVVLPVNPDLIARRRGPARKRTTPRTPAWLACWPWTATPPCVRSSPMASWPASCAPSPATTSGPPATSAGC